MGGSPTGPNPVDRGKAGSKLHVLSDARGLPLVAGVSGANDHDSQALIPLVLGIPAVRSRHGPGTAEDIGCCTGRHLLHLTSRCITAHGIDTCSAAIALARAAGCNADVGDATTHTPPHPVDTVIALGGGLGIAGTLNAAPAFLAHLATWLTPAGRLIASSVDWTATADQHRAWTDHTRATGRYPGDVRVRLRGRDRH